MNIEICEHCDWYKTEGNYKDIHGKDYAKRICMRLTCPVEKRQPTQNRHILIPLLMMSIPQSMHRHADYSKKQKRTFIMKVLFVIRRNNC